MYQRDSAKMLGIHAMTMTLSIPEKQDTWYILKPHYNAANTTLVAIVYYAYSALVDQWTEL